MVVNFIASLLGSGDGGASKAVHGPDAIARARAELRGEADVSAAIMGEPRLVEYSGEFTDDLKVEIPLSTGKYANPAPLTFDVEDDALDRLMDEYGIDNIENIGGLNGETVDIEWQDGTPVPQW